jgi:hypothetical protein
VRGRGVTVILVLLVVVVEVVESAGWGLLAGLMAAANRDAKSGEAALQEGTRS